MEEHTALDILKKAILFEKRGEAFYRKVAEQTDSPEVKEFFEMMAVEEENHQDVLSEQFKAFKEKGRFNPGEYQTRNAPEVASEVLTQALREKISGAGFESAAISAAVSMEERSVELYGKRAETTDDPEEKKLYQWLSDWERDHLNILLDMDRQLTEQIWNDQNFWPF
ncbi:MAG: ferritin-like domain-containing protein [Desulfococcaceae bacterium]